MRRALAFVLLSIACGARTELRGGAGGNDASSPDAATHDAQGDAPILTCASGLVQLAATGAQPDEIALDGDHVYWHDDSGVSRVAKSGGAPEHLATTIATMFPDLVAFTLAGGYVFYQEPLGDVARVAESGGAPDTFPLGGTHYGLATGAAYVYFWSRTVGSTEIDRVDFAGQNLSKYAVVGEPPNEMFFDKDSQAIAVADPGVFDVFQGGADLLSGLPGVDVVGEGTHVYFTSNDATNGARVMVLDIQSLATTPIADTAGAFAIAIDQSDLYFTDRKNERVRRIAKKSGPVTDVAVSAPGFQPVDLAVDGACVYWTSAPKGGSAGAIMAAPNH